MSSPIARAVKLLVYAVLALSAGTAVFALVTSLRHRQVIASASAEPVPVASVASEGTPISSEADVFRTTVADLAIDPALQLRRSAHPRTLATWRNLRAYPGSPPRIPHALTPAEYLRGGCKTCHEKGGYSQRFGAYVPITPHPDMGACLQCHVGDARLLPTDLPGSDPSARCRQCHSTGGMLWRDSALTWKPMSWPQVAKVTRDGPPPPIPHTLEMRGNCVSCHSAPAGVLEIRTPHSARSNCRQCHVEGAK